MISAIIGFSRYNVIGGRIYFKGQDITNSTIDERARLGIDWGYDCPPTLRGLTVREIVQICGKNKLN